MVHEKIKDGLRKAPKWFRCFYAIALLALNGCTYSIIMTHTEGSAVDTVDAEQAASPNVSPTLDLPVVP